MQKSTVRLPLVAHVRTIFPIQIDQDIHTQCALSLKIVVSEWQSVIAVIAVSLNIGGGVPLIRPAKLYMCTPKYYKHNEDGHKVWGVCGHGSVPLSHSGNIVMRIELQQQWHRQVRYCCLRYFSVSIFVYFFFFFFSAG